MPSMLSYNSFSLRSYIWKLLLAGVLLLAWPAAQASMPVAVSANPLPSKLLASGTAAPVFQLKNTDDVVCTFPVAGQWNVIFYWSLFCHSCLEEIPEAQHRLSSMSDVKAFFVALDTAKMQKALQNFCKRRDLKLPVLMEEVASDTWVTADRWGVVSTPAVFIVAPDGKVAYSHEGPTDLDQFFAGFAALQASASATLQPAR